MTVIVLTCSALFLVVLGTAVHHSILLEKRIVRDSTPADSTLGSWLHGRRYRTANTCVAKPWTRETLIRKIGRATMLLLQEPSLPESDHPGLA